MGLKSVHLRFVVVKVELGYIFLEYCSFHLLLLSHKRFVPIHLPITDAV
jgi:hypothetical protein